MAERLRLWLERGDSGYWLRDAATSEAVRWDDERLLVVPVAGASYRLDALDDAGFEPGRRLALVPEPENEHDPNAIGIWDEERRLQAGYVPADSTGPCRRMRRPCPLGVPRRRAPRRAARPDRARGRVDRGSATILGRLMAYEFKLPDLGEGLTEGEIARWLVAEGDEIAEDQPLVEVQTDKTTVEIPRPRPGRSRASSSARARRFLSEPSWWSSAATAPGARPREAEAAEGRRPGRARPGRRPVRATPLVRRVAQELGVDLATVAGTGPQGRVTEDDVRAAASGEAPAPTPLPRASAASRSAASAS